MLIRTALIFCVLAIATPPGVFADEATLQDDQLRVSFDCDSGALTKLEDKATGWIIERRSELGASFRLFVPLWDRRYNPVLGQKQHAVEVKKLSAHTVRLQWKNLISENGGSLPITVTAIVSLNHGVLTFEATLTNASPLTVETMDYPYFGDLCAPARCAPLNSWVMLNGERDSLQSNEVYPHFRIENGFWGYWYGYFGLFYPTKSWEAQQSRFCLLQSSNEGLYVQAGNAALPYRLQYTFEQHPGLVSSINDLVPQEDAISGIPVHLEFRTCHFIFSPPHSSVKLVPIVLRFYKGDWRAGVDLYRPQPSTPVR